MGGNHASTVQLSETLPIHAFRSAKTRFSFTLVRAIKCERGKLFATLFNPDTFRFSPRLIKIYRSNLFVSYRIQIDSHLLPSNPKTIQKHDHAIRWYTRYDKKKNLYFQSCKIRSDFFNHRVVSNSIPSNPLESTWKKVKEKTNRILTDITRP